MAAFDRREYAGAAPKTTLAVAISNSDTTIVATSGTGYPTGATGNFVIVLDRGLSTEEKIKCSARSGATFTVAASGRGHDGTTAVAHTITPTAVTFEHCITAIDMDEANQAVAGTLAKIAAAGDLLYGSAANVLAKLGIGSTNQVLTVVGGVPAWATAPVNSIYLASAQVTGASTISSATAADLSAGALSVSATVPASGRLKLTMGGIVNAADAGFNITVYGTGVNTGNTGAASLGTVLGGGANMNVTAEAVWSTNPTWTIIAYFTGLVPGVTLFNPKFNRTTATNIGVNSVWCVAEAG